MEWQTKTLSEVAYTAGRIGWKGLTAKEYTESGPYFLSVHSLNYGDFVDFRDAFHISNARYEESPEIMLQANDILICKDGAGIGKTGIIKETPGPTTINSSLLLIRALQNIESKFLYYKLCSPSFQNIVQERIEGATTPHLYQREIKLFPISFPSNSEQKRIVALLDTVFADLEQTRAKTEQNLKNARELFDSYLQQVFSQKGDGWVETTLETFSERVSVGHVGSTSKFYCESNVGVPFLRSQNVKPYGIETSNVKYITKEFHQSLKKSQLQKGDLLFVRVGANRGDCCALREFEGELNCANIVFARPRGHSVDFLEHYCNSPIGQESLLGMTTGSAQGVINTKSVALLKVPLPPIEEQLRITDIINNLKSETEKLKIIYEDKLQHIDELKKSILQKAFSGELTNAVE